MFVLLTQPGSFVSAVSIVSFSVELLRSEQTKQTHPHLDVIEFANHIFSSLCVWRVSYFYVFVFLFACQVETLSEEDVDAYLSQAVCLRLKSPLELRQIEVSHTRIIISII